PPNVTLSLPADNYINDSSDPVSVTFECNATDDAGLANISLYITNSSNQSFALNQTTSISGTSNSTSWTLELANGNYTWNCLAYDSSGNSDWGDSNRSLTINYTILGLGRPNLTITLNPDNESSDLNWTNVTNALSYTLYYSDNLCEIINMNLNNISYGIRNITGLTYLNSTDFNASNNQSIYYRVSAVRGSLENLSLDIVGKHTYYLIGTSSGTNDNNRKNWISLALNASYDAETFVQNIPEGLGIRVKKLDRPDNDSYTYITHNKAGPNNFTMELEGGYEIEVSNDINYTIVGVPFVSPFTYQLIGTSSGTNDNKRKDWIGVKSCNSNNTDAETFIQGVPGDVGIRVKKLDRPDNNTYTYITHNKAGPNNFTMDVGGGYVVEVSDNVNYTFI
ncbi:MAG: hypothetical protein KJ896_03850, partial [Nanoarchaeota archaeon]|nr:hypothetical protein [Nanoarchaeota archaeon]